MILVVLPLWDEIEVQTGFGFRITDDRKKFVILMDGAAHGHTKLDKKCMEQLINELKHLHGAMK